MTTQTRQTWLCPYEAPLPPTLWPQVPTPPGAKRPSHLKADDRWPTVCPAYSTSLPETIELARSWSWAERGELRTFCGGQPNGSVIDGVDIFGGAVAEFRDFKCTTCASENK